MTLEDLADLFLHRGYLVKVMKVMANEGGKKEFEYHFIVESFDIHEVAPTKKQLKWRVYDEILSKLMF